MSDYMPKDPLDPRNTTDRYGNATNFEPVDEGGKGPYILLGLLVAIGLIGGMLYFNGAPKNDNVAQAPARPAIERTMPTPAPALPTAKPAAPADTATPAPADTAKQ